MNKKSLFDPDGDNVTNVQSTEIILQDEQLPSVDCTNVTNPAQAYLLELNSKKSHLTMTSNLNIVADILGAKSLHDCQWAALRRPHVQAIIQKLLDKELSPNTINTYLAAIKGVAQQAWILKLMETDDYHQIRLVKRVKGSRVSSGRALETDEINNLFDLCDQENTAKSLRDAAILGVLYGCGLRRAEIVALNYNHVDWKAEKIKVLGKGNKERISFMPDDTVARLRQWIDQVRGTHSGPLFTRIRRHDDVTDARLTDQAIYYILQTRRQQAGLDHFSPHDLRRTFASSMVDNGEDMITVRDAMGHSSIQTTEKYDKRGDERLKKASKRIKF